VTGRILEVALRRTTSFVLDGEAIVLGTGWHFPRGSATSIADIDSFATIALFSGLGLLLSPSVLILDQYIPGEWFSVMRRISRLLPQRNTWAASRLPGALD
jgi:hypothetical protein